MKQHLTAIAFNEKELESYVSQLVTGGFEAISEVKKAEDGSFFQALIKTVRQPVHLVHEKTVGDLVETGNE
jgi:hypothetical protein